MTIVSDDPSWWPTISYFRGFSYFTVAATTVLVYDWVLTLANEIELIWEQRWSLMTFLYLSVRYVGIPYSIIYIIESVSTISVTDIGCMRLYFAANWTVAFINPMLGIIMISRLYAMYRGSRKILAFLIMILLVATINSITTASIERRYMSAEEAVLSGQHLCGYVYDGAAILLSETWIVNAVWEISALCLSVWIAAKHFREVRQQSTGRTIMDVLIRSHVFYFVSFAAVSCLTLGILSPKIADSQAVGTEVYDGILQIAQTLQMFILGPRLILSVRQVNAELVNNSDEGTAMTTIAFGERIVLQESSSGDV